MKPIILRAFAISWAGRAPPALTSLLANPLAAEATSRQSWPRKTPLLAPHNRTSRTGSHSLRSKPEAAAPRTRSSANTKAPTALSSWRVSAPLPRARSASSLNAKLKFSRISKPPNSRRSANPDGAIAARRIQSPSACPSADPKSPAISERIAAIIRTPGLIWRCRWGPRSMQRKAARSNTPVQRAPTAIWSKSTTGQAPKPAMVTSAGSRSMTMLRSRRAT